MPDSKTGSSGSDGQSASKDGRWSRWGRQGYDKSIKISDWVSPYANAISAKVGGERFWPQSNDMPLEIEKCERILRAFTVEGVAQKEVKEDKVQDGKGNWIQKKVRVLRKVPPAAIRNAKGICIFSSMRSGIAPFGGGGGSGLFMARLPTGAWSAPSAVTPQNMSAGLLLGIDFLDCILLINSDKALASFMSHRVDVGAETGLTAGPYGGGLSAEAGLDRAPIYSYVRTRGAYAGVELMGQVFFHRFDENERFYYWPGISTRDVLTGKVRIPPAVYPLHRALRDAETGRAQGGKLERTEFDLVKIPESELFSQLGPNAPRRKKRFVAGGSSTSGTATPLTQTSEKGKSQSTTSLDSLNPDGVEDANTVGNPTAESGGPATGYFAGAGVAEDGSDDDEEFVQDGEKLRLPPTPAELEMMEAAGLLDDEDLRQQKEERKRIYEMPAPPMHVQVQRYWSTRPTLAARRRQTPLVMDGPHGADIREAQFTPLPVSPRSFEDQDAPTDSSSAAQVVPEEGTPGMLINIESDAEEPKTYINADGEDVLIEGASEEQVDHIMDLTAAGSDADGLYPPAVSGDHGSVSTHTNETLQDFEDAEDNNADKDAATTSSKVSDPPGAIDMTRQDIEKEEQRENAAHEAEPSLSATHLTAASSADMVKTASVSTEGTADGGDGEARPKRPPRRKRG